MIPYPTLSTTLEVNPIEYSNRSYNMSTKQIQGFVDGLEALRQSIAKRIGTQRFDHPIYSFSYGIDWRSLIGQPPEYYRPEAKRMIEESLIQDDRILEVSNFKFEFGIRSCSISFNVQSIFGNYRESMEVPA